MCVVTREEEDPSIAVVERDNSVVECWTRNRDISGSIPPFATVLKFGYFRSLHDVPVHSSV